MTESSDGELARHVAAGTLTAEGELCRRFSTRIRLYGLRHLRDEQAAADLVQDVLVTVLEALRAGRVRDPEEIGSFMLGTCRLTAMNQKRGGKRRAQMLDTFGDVLGGTVEPFTIAGADLDKLRGCVERLTERDRTVVMLTFYAEEPAEEIARALETTAGNVRVLRHRALSRLQACVERGWEMAE
ncbi:MAG: polymerase subunit sigma-24 [Myxococcales bacterium]|nr:polymerase subunit sigma-24 [Myxococcales bacterium]